MRGAAAIALLPLVAAGCHGGDGGARPPVRTGPPNVVRVALDDVRWPVDPAHATSEAELTLARALVATPLRIGRDGTLRRGLCLPSQPVRGGRTFRLRCAHAARLARRLTRLGADPRAPYGWVFAGGRFSGRNGTLTIELRRPWRRFLHALGSPATALPGIPGPFRVVSATPGRVVARRPGLRLEFVELPPHRAVAAFRAGRVDVAAVPFGELGALRADDDLRHELRVRRLLALDVVGFDLAGGRLAELPNTRAAYWVTATRGEYAALVAERAAPAAVSLLPGQGPARPSEPHVVREARRRIVDLPPVPVTVIAAGDRELVFGAEHVVATWREVGLAARPPSPGAAEAADATLRRITPPYAHAEAVVASILLPRDGRNPWRARPSAARASLLEALAAEDPEAALRRADAVVAREAAVVPLAWAAGAWLVSSRLDGWWPDALGGVDYTSVRALASSRSR